MSRSIAHRRVSVGTTAPRDIAFGMAHDAKPTIFWEIHSGLPREGPGDNESTRRAFRLANELPRQPRILDVGCGPGMQTIELAQISDGTIAALDTHQPFLDELERRARAVSLSDRVKTVRGSMSSMPFRDDAFDLIWSEGAMYMIGFREGLAAWKRLLTPRGYVAVTEPCWLETDIPDVVKAHWAEYPAMTTIESTRKIIGESGFREIGHFVLPDSSWWDDYYDPMARRLVMLREKYRGDPGALSVIEESERELAVHREYSHLYGYVFFVMQRDS